MKGEGGRREGGLQEMDRPVEREIRRLEWEAEVSTSWWPNQNRFSNFGKKYNNFQRSLLRRAVATETAYHAILFVEGSKKTDRCRKIGVNTSSQHFHKEILII